ncbi:unnamed protein product, partial [Callosobruchus maculatus]
VLPPLAAAPRGARQGQGDVSEPERRPRSVADTRWCFGASRCCPRRASVRLRMLIRGGDYSESIRSKRVNVKHLLFSVAL